MRMKPTRSLALAVALACSFPGGSFAAEAAVDGKTGSGSTVDESTLPPEELLPILHARAREWHPEITAATAPQEGRKIAFPQTQSTPAPRFSRKERRMLGDRTIWMAVLVRKNGRVGDAKTLLEADAPLRQSAIETVRSWSFRPGTVNGEPHDFVLLLPIRPGA